MVPGVPIVEQWLTDPTRNHEVEGSIPEPQQELPLFKLI